MVLTITWFATASAPSVASSEGTQPPKIEVKPNCSPISIKPVSIACGSGARSIRFRISHAVASEIFEIDAPLSLLLLMAHCFQCLCRRPRAPDTGRCCPSWKSKLPTLMYITSVRLNTAWLHLHSDQGRAGPRELERSTARPDIAGLSKRICPVMNLRQQRKASAPCKKPSSISRSRPDRRIRSETAYAPY